MLIHRAIDKIKNKNKTENTKISLALPVELKKRLDMFASDYEVTTTALIVQILEMATTNGQQGLIEVQNFVKDLEAAEDEYMDLMQQGLVDADEAKRAEQLERQIRIYKQYLSEIQGGKEV